jgi:hypothetical protein
MRCLCTHGSACVTKRLWRARLRFFCRSGARPLKVETFLYSCETSRAYERLVGCGPPAPARGTVQYRAAKYRRSGHGNRQCPGPGVKRAHRSPTAAVHPFSADFVLCSCRVPTLILYIGAMSVHSTDRLELRYFLAHASNARNASNVTGQCREGTAALLPTGLVAYRIFPGTCEPLANYSESVSTF